MKNIFYTLLFILLGTTANYAQNVIGLDMDSNGNVEMDGTPQNGSTYQVDLTIIGIDQENLDAMVQHFNKVPFVTFTIDNEKLNFVFDTNHSYVQGWTQSNWDKWFDQMATRLQIVKVHGM